jgi:hypothetical protein
VPAAACACSAEHLIRSSRHIVQDRPLRSVPWADIPELSMYVGCCPAAWLQSGYSRGGTALILGAVGTRSSTRQAETDRRLAVSLTPQQATNDVDRDRMEHLVGRVKWFKAWLKLQAS